LFLSLCLPPEAFAEPGAPRTELFTGFEASDNYSSGYVGAGYAFGKAGFAAPGFRLRAVGAYGRYDYEGLLPLDGISLPTTFDGQNSFGAALLGYEFRPGRLILKLFAGIEAEDQHIVPHDPDNSVQGSALGLRLQVESWYDLSARSFLSADASYGTAFQEYWSLLRLGWRVTPASRWGSKAARSATRNMMPDAAAVSRGSFSARWKSRSPAASPAIIWKTSRADMWRSAFIDRSSCGYLHLV
jgi:hypothetical protein